MPKFDIDHLLEVAQQHGNDAEPDCEVGDLQEFLRAAWAQLSEQQKAAFFADPVVGAAYEGATVQELREVFPKNPFAATRVITDADVKHIEGAMGLGAEAWGAADKKKLLAEVMHLAGVPTEFGSAPASTPPARRRPRP